MSEWIDINEKLPPLKKYVVVLCKGNRFPIIASRNGVRDFWAFYSSQKFPLEKVCYWMPLPNRPEGHK